MTTFSMMDASLPIQDGDVKSLEEPLLAGTKRFNSFRDNRQLPRSNVHKKRRSHSRGNSIANLDEIHKPVSTVPSPPRSRPSSHHRRQSSVSSRRASAEVMGIPLPDEDRDKPSALDDFRSRALLALEGKTPSPITPTFSFSKVELPDLSATSPEPKLDLAAALGTGVPRVSTGSSSSLTGKRDSFGNLLTPASSCASKKELGTLLEENEGEEEEALGDSHHLPPVSPLPHRHRPTSLKLRPLSLRASSSLPTPSPTPPLLNSTKLKSLTLAPASVVAQAAALGPPKRSSAVVRGGSPMLSTVELDASLQRSYSVGTWKPDGSPLAKPALLTPNDTPSSLTPHGFDMRGRNSPSPEAAHTTYLAQSHASLLARIAELENALAIKDDRSSPALTEPSEELLEMLADLKTERDNLKKELDEARAKSIEQERQLALLNRRIDNERREVWVTKEKLAISEAASKVIEEDRDELRAEVKKLQDMLAALKGELSREKKEKIKVESELRELLETPKVPHLAVKSSKTSFDSQVTNVDESPLDTKLKLIPTDMGVVPEEDEEVFEDARSDGSFHSRSASFAFDIHTPTSACATEGSTYQPYQIPRRRDSLDAGWSFSNAASAPRQRQPQKEVDLFFTCLERVDSDEPGYVKPLVEVTAPKRQPKILGLGFGFDLLDEDNDPNFNFGQPVNQKPYNFRQPEPEEQEEESSLATPIDTDEEDLTCAPAPLPFLDDEDSAFSFGASQDSSTGSRSTSPDFEDAGLITPRLTPPQRPPISDANPSVRPENRSRSRVTRESVDLRSTNWSFPRSAPAHISSFASNAPPPIPMSPVAQTFPIMNGKSSRPLIPESIMLAMEPQLSPPPSKKAFTFGRSTTVPIPATPTRVEPASKPRPPMMISPPAASQAQRPYYQDMRLPGKPAQPAKPGLFANLANLLPSSWSPRTQREQPLPSPLASPVESPRTSGGFVSRERQLERLRREATHSSPDSSSGFTSGSIAL